MPKMDQIALYVTVMNSIPHILIPWLPLKELRDTPDLDQMDDLQHT